eukprot:gene66541-biopygen48841
MMCSFTASPLIFRIYGRGRAVHPTDADWTQLRPLFGPPLPGERQLILVEIDSIQTSCGFGVPFFDYVGERPTLIDYAVKKGPDGMAAYRTEKNQRSIDGLPTGLPSALIRAYADVHAAHGVPFDEAEFLRSVGHADYAFDPWRGFGPRADRAALETARRERNRVHDLALP